jgi:hypothetical protein
MVVQITTAVPPVPQVQSALCPGVSCLHLLCSLKAARPGSVSPQCNARGPATPTALFVGVDSSWDDPS